MVKNAAHSIVFFGSGPVAAECLKLLNESEQFTVEKVITKPVPPHHKHDAPVLKLAAELNLGVITAANKRELDEVMTTNNFTSRIAILIDFGIIVSQLVIDKFELGIVNSHFSLLPEWRGADPITFSILSANPETGVSLMLLDTGMDTGEILDQQKLFIHPSDTGSTLTPRLIELSHKMLVSSVPAYICGELKPSPQPSSPPATYSRKLTKDDGIINFNEPAEVIERKVRAFQPWPKCKTEFYGQRVILLSTHVEASCPDDEKKTALYKECGDGQFLVIDELIAPSGKRMNGEAFMRGYAPKEF